MYYSGDQFFVLLQSSPSHLTPAAAKGSGRPPLIHWLNILNEGPVICSSKYQTSVAAFGRDSCSHWFCLSTCWLGWSIRGQGGCEKCECCVRGCCQLCSLCGEVLSVLFMRGCLSVRTVACPVRSSQATITFISFQSTWKSQRSLLQLLCGTWWEGEDVAVDWRQLVWVHLSALAVSIFLTVACLIKTAAV